MSETNNNFKAAPIHWVILIGLSLVWGCSFLFIKRGLESFSAIQVAALRMGISGVAFIPYIAFRLHKIDWSKWKYYLLVGLLGSALPAILFAMAQTQVNSSVSGVLNALAPLFTLVFGILLFGAPFIKPKVIGVLVGLLGAIVLMVFGQKIGESRNMWFGLFCIAGTMCYGINTNMVGKYLKGVNPIDVSAVAYVAVGIPYLFILFGTTNFVEVMQTNPQAYESLKYLCALALLGTVIANALFIHLIQQTNPLFGSSVTYIMPIVSIVLGAKDHESISIYHFIGMALILLGVYITNRKYSQSALSAANR